MTDPELWAAVQRWGRGSTRLVRLLRRAPASSAEVRRESRALALEGARALRVAIGVLRRAWEEPLPAARSEPLTRIPVETAGGAPEPAAPRSRSPRAARRR
jgi:hypothetical protein